ncbi:RES family NAD+ phosphorylase [Azotobacter chroococcum]|uniref:RES domain-containing protein n=2 Tax=Azotobacter chroococcum TaxID=353 RepID=A0A0C4WT88_9GAMM|nr:RES family NAD+ phosphorylase [Azotobacter chroococcum]AJE23921.1 RES domain-containing protein [Azotobacter chroococcum NCIMB 8003]QQE91044.1 RES family NAD+ phosphorylase [Azotobacter chroococcum]
MILWRISAYADLSGIGGLRASGRWHHLGRPVVYAADSPAGAMLEVLVHLEIDPEDFPTTLQLIRVELPDLVSRAELPPLPEHWKSDPEVTRAMGDRFLDGRSALLLPVPSAIIPCTTNYLFNPAHPEASGASIQAEKFPLDSRLI